MEKELTKIGPPNMLRCVQDLALKSFAALRCAACKLYLEGPSCTHLTKLEEKIVELENERSEL